LDHIIADEENITNPHSSREYNQLHGAHIKCTEDGKYTSPHLLTNIIKEVRLEDSKGTIKPTSGPLRNLSSVALDKPHNLITKRSLEN
jgi:hypothetical protein